MVLYLRKYSGKSASRLLADLQVAGIVIHSRQVSIHPRKVLSNKNCIESYNI